MKLKFEGGHYGFDRNVEDGTWCDVWVFDDLAVPTGFLHAPAGTPRNQQRNVPATYDDFRPGTHDQKARLEDPARREVATAGPGSQALRGSPNGAHLGK